MCFQAHAKPQQEGCADIRLARFTHCMVTPGKICARYRNKVDRCLGRVTPVPRFPD